MRWVTPARAAIRAGGRGRSPGRRGICRADVRGRAAVNPQSDRLNLRAAVCFVWVVSYGVVTRGDATVGFSRGQRHRTWGVLAGMTDTLRRPGRSAGRLLERQAELLAVDFRLTQLCEAQWEGFGPRGGGLLAFAGRAGIGKTAVIAEARRRAAARGCMVLSARGSEQRQCVAFHVVRELLQPFFAAVGGDQARAMLGGWLDIVGPAIGLTAPDAPLSPDPQGVRDGLDWVLTQIAVRHAPVVMMVDDVHWADRESLDWITGFAARAEELPVLVVAAYRPEEMPGTDGLRNLAERHGPPFALAPLSGDAVGLLLGEQLGAAPDEAFARECWTLTAGNPFETVEVAVAVRDKGLVPRAQNISHLRNLVSAVKGTTVLDSMRQLGASAVRFAWAAAVLGTGIRPTLVANVGGLGMQEALDAAERLCLAGILTPRNGELKELEEVCEEDLLEFRHPLVASIVYRAIPAATRVALHGQAAAAVLDAGHGACAAARHLLETHPDSDPWTLRQLREAARETLRSGAPDAARRFLARALREPPPPEERAAVLFELGCSALLNDPAATINYLRAALAEPELDPGLREAVTCRLAQILAHTERLDEAVDLVTAEARRAGSAATRMRMHAEYLMWDRFRADGDELRGSSRQLIRLAKRLRGRDRAEQHILGLRAADAVMRAEPADIALHYADRALGPGLAWADENWGFEVPVIIALVYMMCDQPTRAEELFLQGIDEFERYGWRGSHLSLTHTLLGYVHYRTGRLGEAEECVRAGWHLADRIGAPVAAQRYAAGCLLQILLARGRIDEARATADAFTKVRPRSPTLVLPDLQAALGRLLLARGRTRQAEGLLGHVGRTMENLGVHNPAWCRWQLDLALAQASHHPEQARATADTALSRAHSFGTASAIGQSLRITAQLREDHQALPLLAEAVDHLQHSPARYELACALTDHGRALLRADRLSDAATQLTRGVEIATACGANDLAERARTELEAGLAATQGSAPGRLPG